MTELLIKALGICIVSASLSQIFKQKNGEYGVLISLGAGCVVAFFVFSAVAEPIKLIKDLMEDYGLNSQYFKVAVKVMGIGYITSFFADVCRDSGQASLAQKAELAGKCGIFILSVPLGVAVLETAVGFIK